MSINRRGERLPFCFCRTDELSPWCIVRYAPVKPRYLKTQQAEIREQKQDESAIRATYPKQSLSPF